MSTQDKAGEHYWSENWDERPLPDVWAIDSRRLRHHVEKALFEWIAQSVISHGLDRASTKLVEVGCARSQVLPLFAKRLGVTVHGIDYSPVGCEQASMILRREGVAGDVYCANIFAVPDHLVGGFDVVVSFGLIEHFADTAAVVTALAGLLRPGGLIFTNIPNMCGIGGFVQRIINRRIYDIHVPLTPREVKDAHERAGIEVIECDYFLCSNLGIINLGIAERNKATWWMKRFALGGLSRISMIPWLLERATGRRLPVSRAFSPYVNCIGRRR